MELDVWDELYNHLSRHYNL